MDRDRYRPKGKDYLLVNDETELKVDVQYLSKLKIKQSNTLENRCMLCLHNDIRAGMHEMINVIAKGEYIRPHYHPNKTETKIIFEGRMLVVLFEKNGDIRDKIVMSDDKKNCFLIRVDKGITHISIPLSDVIFYEAATGPYIGKDDSIFPEWAPEEDNKEEISKLYTRLEIKKYLEND